MAKLFFENRVLTVTDEETVLDGLLRHGVAVPSGCRSGVCQSCVMKAVDRTPPEAAQTGLRDNLKERGFFLACQWRPDGDVAIALPEQEVLRRFTLPVTGRDDLSPAVVRLRLAVDPAFHYRAGQFINVYRDDGLVRSYSLASTPVLDSELELHVQKVAGGRMSRWLREEVVVGDHLTVSEPLGDLCYRSGVRERNLLLIGTGTGLGPLYGIAREALESGHHGAIHLYHGSGFPEGLYLRDVLQHLAGDFPNFHYWPSVSRVDSGIPGVRRGRAAALAMAEHPDLRGWLVYLCGHPEMVSATRRAAFLAGARLGDIRADPFIVNAAPEATPA